MNGIKQTKNGMHKAVFSGTTAMFVPWIVKEKPDFDFLHRDADGTFTIFFEGSSTYADSMVDFIRNNGYTLIERN